MKRIVLLAAIAAAVAGVAFGVRAQTVTWNWTFESVDAVSVNSYNLYVTGILEAGSTPVEVNISFSSGYTTSYDMLAACQRMALLSMEKPGKYKLQLSRGASTNSPACRLVRVTP